MRVLGRSTSGNVQKVILLLEAMGADYSREDFGRQFENTGTDEYLAMNPTGKVPTLVDGDVVVWESNTILRYIAAKANSPLYPADLATRARIERWMDWLLASVNTPYVKIFMANKNEKPIPEESVKELSATLSIVDQHLSQSAFLAGDALTIADICHAPVMHRCLNFPIDLPPLQALRAWHDRLSERPAFKAVVAG